MPSREDAAGAVARRPDPLERSQPLYVGELEIRPSDGLVLASGAALFLSVREFELLVAMAQRADTVLTREDLYAHVWGGRLRVGDRSVDVYVSKLRTKLEAAIPNRRFIHTHSGFGYRFGSEPGPVSNRVLPRSTRRTG